MRPLLMMSLTAALLYLSTDPAPAQTSGTTAPAQAAPVQAAPVQAAPALPAVDPVISQFLSSTPVTLLDWGMMRLDRDLKEAAKRLNLDRDRNGPTRSGTQFRFGDRRVLVYLSVIAPKATRTAENCQTLFTSVRDELLTGAPGGSMGAEWYLQRTFGSDFRGQNSQRPEPFGTLLLDMVLLEITLRPPEAEALTEGALRLACAGRLNAETATLVPIPQRPPAG